MTKKSAARLARDADKKKINSHLANNSAWDDLKKSGEAIRELLVFDYGVLGTFFDQPPLMQLVPSGEQPRVTASLDALRNDVNSLVTIHSEIAAKHADKTGRVTTEEDGLRTNEIYMAYMDLASRFEQLDKPIIDYLNGVRLTVTTKVIEMEAELAKQDPAEQPDQPAEQG